MNNGQTRKTESQQQHQQIRVNGQRRWENVYGVELRTKNYHRFRICAIMNAIIEISWGLRPSKWRKMFEITTSESQQMKTNDQMMALEKRTKKNMKNKMNILQTIFFVVVVVIFWYMFLSWKTAAVAEALLVVLTEERKLQKACGGQCTMHGIDLILFYYVLWW